MIDPIRHTRETGGSDPFRHWHLTRDPEGICWLGLDQQESGTNVLSRAVLEEFEAVVASLEREPGKGLVIFSDKPGTFIAGADIKEFPKIRNADEAYQLVRQGQQLMARLEGLRTPSVAVINGFALGGGLELALACHWRIGLQMEEPCMGLPEILLGLHPGFGGTVRAVRLAGVRQAMDLMLTGRSIDTVKALRLGLVDRLAAPDDWRRVARQVVTSLRRRRHPPLLDRVFASAPLRSMVARSLENRVRERANPSHYPAPYALIDLWRRHAGDADEGYDAEARSFARLAETPTSRNLVRVFFLQERLKRGGDRSRPPMQKVHVVGAGIMGGDIAAWCALKGMTVSLQDRELKFVEPALARAEKLFAKRLKTDQARSAARSRLIADVQGNGVPGADLVIEAIFEDRDAKQALYRQLLPRMRSDALLATNTSSIPLQELIAGLEDPRRFIGLHFFNPVAKLPLVEVVQTADTSAAVLEAGLGFVRQISKLGLPCQSQPGFLVNRILAPYMAEAMELAREDVPLVEIDNAAVDFGMPMGPVELADSVGLDIALHVAEILAPVTGRVPGPELKAMVKAGQLGQKSGRGFYLYQDGRPVRPRGALHDARPDLQERLVMSLLNEAADCVGEAVVADADLVDAGVIFGTGFAPFRGGPLHYARQQGIDTILSTLTRLEQRFGARFSPSPGWAKIQASG